MLWVRSSSEQNISSSLFRRRQNAEFHIFIVPGFCFCFCFFVCLGFFFAVTGPCSQTVTLSPSMLWPTPNPYGEDRPVSKLDCVNHMHKRMGTALHKLAMEEQLGSKGHSCLLFHKWDKLQGYFPTAVPNNPGSQEDLWNAVWASCFPIIHAHCGTAIRDNQGNLDNVTPKIHVMMQHTFLHVLFLGIQVYKSI